jgi:putative heme transporter
MIPITPGGLGLVEPSLTGLLVLAEVNSGQAVLATLTYRLASYWAPLLAGPVAYALFRIRYRARPSPAPRRRTSREPPPGTGACPSAGCRSPVTFPAGPQGCCRPGP